MIEGPSGVGKDTIIKELMKRFPMKFKKIPSYTTRPPRVGEVDGFTYNFIDEKTFFEKLESGDIFEHTIRHGAYRGISKTLVDEIVKGGFVALKDADEIGLHALQKAFPGRVLSIFITADKNVIRKHLVQRGCDEIEERLADYENCLKEAGQYDYTLENNGTLDAIVSKVLGILEKNI